MQFRKLGTTDLDVSLIGLGTMTFGEQNTEAQAHEQLDYAYAQGVNLVDVAEMYPVPPRAETYGCSERFVGSWLKKTGLRSKIVLATKIAGPSRQAGRPSYIRGAANQFDKPNLVEALNGSLQRLGTDYVDLYQLHWPDRSTTTFGRTAYPYEDEPFTVPIEETLQALSDLVKEGKIRHIGVSNETPWGVARFLAAAQQMGLERIVSIQNPYNLLNRTFEVGLSEFSHRDGVGLLAYSPLAFGWLSGKYENGERPAGARITLFERFTRYTRPQAVAATSAYVNLARSNGLSPATMALAFVNRQPFLTSNLVGATTLDQLKENIASINVTLSEDLVKGIEAIHERYPNPAP
ncbi:MAG TPA: NADP(H)-dependent aldo-keto reductase [Pusillimonas sp.]|uniref:NADP(H)-dependent aldo-keto reductase n=1 Tax=Pusillimonas sp. TaxID=3040095 RepID=UPI002BF9F9D9|nr:NADP(H)-dependent aldo-keto reductase [Pusillimonas sp.]HUH86921.1 NADP(H)-dependent aldo-keto reductase [Pusillimonas sp.]